MRTDFASEVDQAVRMVTHSGNHYRYVDAPRA